METIKSLILRADTEGCVEIHNGVVLHSKENIIEEQKDWAETDEAKNIDFAVAPYWIITDSGTVPESILDESDLSGYL